MSRLKDVPELRRDGGNLSEVMQIVREALQTFRGYRGDVLDKALTLRDLSADMRRGLTGGGLITGGITGGGYPVTIPSGTTYTIDPTPPPTPTGLTVSAAISNIFIECDNPTYTAGHGHDRTVVYGAQWPTGGTEPTFSAAVPLCHFQGTVASYATNPNTRWCIWIKWESIDGFLSSSPAGGTNGAQVTTGQDVSTLIEALSGKIGASELDATLTGRVNLIDAASTGLIHQYVNKVDVNGYITGYGFAVTANNATPTSVFGIRSDAFYIASPTGPGITPTMPFIVQTTPTTVGGVSVPAGIYMTDAYIMNGTIGNAKIANLAVDDAKIASLSVSKLVAGTLAVGQYMQSTSYVAGTSGWKVHANGTAEFGAASIRGQLTASQIDTRGLSIYDTAGNVILAAGASLAASTLNFPGTITNVPGSIDNNAIPPGTNLAVNAGFLNGSLDGWTAGPGPNGSAFSSNLGEWTISGGSTAYIYQPNGNTTSYDELISTPFPIIPNARYEYYMFTGAHRCTVEVFIYWFNSSGSIIGNASLYGNPAAASGGAILSGYMQTGGFGVAPSSAAYGKLMLRKGPTYSGNTNSWAFFTNAYVGQASSAQSTFSTWSAGPDTVRALGFSGDLNATANQSDATTNAGISYAGTIANWGGVSGRPSNLAALGGSEAINNALISLGTLGAGAFAYLNAITGGNISTYISSAAISDAYIANLSASKINAGSMNAAYITAGTITTDRLVANAATASSGGSTGSVVSTGSSVYTIDSTTTTVFSLTTTGAPVTIGGYINVQAYSNNSTIVSCYIAGLVVVDGVTEGGFGVKVLGGSSSIAANATIPVSLRLTGLSAGSHTFAFFARAFYYNSSGSLTVCGSVNITGLANLFAQENKV